MKTHWTFLWLSVALLVFGCGPKETPTDKNPRDSAEKKDNTKRPASDTPTDDGPKKDTGDPDSGDVPPDNGSDLSPPDGDDSHEEFRQLIAALGSKDDGIRKPAVAALAGVGDDVTAKLLALIADPEVEVRRGAAFGLLGRFNPDDAEIVAALTEALSDEDGQVRSIGLQAINQLDDQQVLPTLAKLVVIMQSEDEAKHLRTQLARRFARLGPEAAEILPQIVQTLRESVDRDVRAACLNAAHRIAIDPREALPILIAVLKDDKDAGLRRVAAMRIGDRGMQATDAIPVLLAALSDEDATVRAKAADTLARIGPDAVGPLVSRFDSDDREMRVLAIYAVGRMGPAAAEKTEARLEELTKDEDVAVRRAAELSLARVRGQL
jgi:HEAT repeat protein